MRQEEPLRRGQKQKHEEKGTGQRRCMGKSMQRYIKATYQGEWNTACLPLTKKVGTSGGVCESVCVCECVSVYVSLCVSVCMSAYVYVSECVCVCQSVCLCICACVCLCVCLCVCVYVTGDKGSADL